MSTQIKIPALANASSRIGAAMGREDTHAEVKIVYRVHINPEPKDFDSKAEALRQAQNWASAAGGAIRVTEEEVLLESSPVTFQLMRLRWVDGDYDDGGAYWGSGRGEHIYRAYSSHGVDLYKRAKSFQDAEAQIRKQYPLATFEYQEDEAEEKFWFSTGSGRIELAMTLEQARSVSHSGQCDADVDALMADPFIARQLEVITPETLRRELREYGAWNAEELANHPANLRRILWLAGGDIRDSNLT